MNIESLETRLRNGYFTEILVTPAEVVAGSDIRRMSIDKRQCLFSDEIPHHMKIFNFYSEVRVGTRLGLFGFLDKIKNIFFSFRVCISNLA